MILLKVDFNLFVIKTAFKKKYNALNKMCHS